MWMQIHIVANELMARYPNTLKDDLDILKKDDAKPTLGTNKRNCILFRKGEKEVL